MSIRIGQGTDTHQLQSGIPLILAGISIPYLKGSKGHSDGDVVFHAIVDALLGALALGDIGQHFPSSDDKWKHTNSQTFIEHANSLINDKGYHILNIDTTIILQEPHIGSYIPQMISNLAKILNLDIDCISIKATTTDQLGFIGKSEGLSASSVVLLSSNNTE